MNSKHEGTSRTDHEADLIEEFKKAMIEVESSWKNTMDLLVNA